MVALSQPPNLTNRRVLITGASSGLGAHFAVAIANAGATVALAARRKDRLLSLTQHIESLGGQAVAIEMDVTDETSIEHGFEAAENALGPISSVVANAGMNIPRSALKMSISDFKSMSDVNLIGVFATAREAARRMISNGSAQSGDGRIVLMGSIASVRVLDKLVAYNATKAAVLMMGKALAKEWASKGINVNTLCPGWIETELNVQWLASPDGQNMLANFPRKRAMKPTDLDHLLMFLLSDASQAITGAEFVLDDAQSI